MTLKKYAIVTLIIAAQHSMSVAQSSSAKIPTTPAESSSAKPAGTSTVQIKPVEAPAKAFSLSTYIEMSEKISKEETTPKENSLSLMLAPSYKISDLLTASGKIVINKDNFGQRDTTVSDGTIALAIKGITISDQLKTTHSVSTLMPLSETTVKRDRLKTNIAISNGIAFSGDYLTVSYKLGLSRNFHEFTQNADGSANVQYRISQAVSLKIPVTEQLYVSADGLYRIGYTYSDFNRFGFGFDADVNYDFTPQFSANIGTSNEAAALKANGTDSNISAYDEDTSVVRAGASYNY